jgi:small subunit ribosomal protein S4
MEGELLARLKKLGILQETAVLDDVLDLTIEDILERRLQTIVFRKSLTRTIFQSRQLITHAHISINNRRITIPGYLVPKTEEPQIAYSTTSTVSNQEHALRISLTIVKKEPELRQSSRGRRGGRGGGGRF